MHQTGHRPITSSEYFLHIDLFGVLFWKNEIKSRQPQNRYFLTLYSHPEPPEYAVKTATYSDVTELSFKNLATDSKINCAADNERYPFVSKHSIFQFKYTYKTVNFVFDVLNPARSTNLSEDNRIHDAI